MNCIQARIGTVALAVSLLMFACSSAKPVRSQKALQPSVAGTNSSLGGGPTLRLDYGKTDATANPISVFMYFVPLISPEPVSITQNPGNTQSARVLPIKLEKSRDSFSLKCEFVITGTGMQENVFDLSRIIARNQAKLKAGGTLEKQLSYINVIGPGHGAVEVEGVISNGVQVVSLVRLHFGGYGMPSPVTIGLENIRSKDGEVLHEDQLVVQVETLTFRRTAGPPMMEVTVGSVKRKGAGNGLWQRVMGSVKGAAANLLIKPLTVEATGQKAMLDFGAALAMQQPQYTFPKARNLKPESKP
ncbi:MAG TPA: hypothetical protein VMZ27_14815 [Candidatus Saccharimonadales bacterium]|nr:hypothetical protein [Candidatus Saccharimonadales bacterium]